jgi:hypothetical protein
LLLLNPKLMQLELSLELWWLSLAAQLHFRRQLAQHFEQVCLKSQRRYERTAQPPQEINPKSLSGACDLTAQHLMVSICGARLQFDRLA